MSKAALESVAAEFRSGNGVPVERATFTLERMQEVLEAYAAAKVRMTQAWQPFDTAHQGELCLFYDANALDVPGCMFTDWVVDGRFYGVRSRKATHWMSLPTHPAK